MSEIRIAAENYYDAGVVPIPVIADGTKRPAVKWGEWHDQPYARDHLDQLFADAAAIGVICGRASGNLELLEFEGRAIDEIYVEFLKRIRSAGMMAIWRDIAVGYTVKSPGGGMHVLMRIDGEPLGNRKLARRPATAEELAENSDDPVKVLIETRGQGGFVVVPPSNGQAHPSGNAWQQVTGGPSSIVTVTEEQRDAIYAIAASFDQMPPVDRSESVRLPSVPRVSSDDHPFDWYRDNCDPLDELLADGWQIHHQTGSEIRLTRPGKNPRDGHSATYHTDTKMLNVFTSSAPLEYQRAGKRTGAEISLSAGQIYAAVHTRGEQAAAMSRIRKNLMPAAVGPAEPVATGIGISTDEGVSSAETVVRLNLPDEFWEARWWGEPIRRLAWTRGISPDAVLGAVLARYPALVPLSYTIPPIAGMVGTFDHMSILVGESSAGKSSAAYAASQLLPDRFERTHRWGVMPSSGEGLCDAFYDDVEEEDDKGKKKIVRKKVRTAVHFEIDEATTFVAQKNRGGNNGGGETIIGVLTGAWSGRSVGQEGASKERRRPLPAGTYRVAGLMGIQTANGWMLLTDDLVDTGLSGRLVFFAAEDPNIPDWRDLDIDIHAEVEPLDLPVPPTIAGKMHLDVHPDVITEIRDAHWSKVRKERIEAAIDGHTRLARLKIAGMFALMDSRTDLSVSDWRLAGLVVDSSIRIRSRMQAAKSEAVERQAAARGHVQGITEVAKDDVKERRAILRLATTIRSRCEEQEWSYNRLRKETTSSTTKHRFNDAVQRAVDNEWVEVIDVKGTGQPGKHIRKARG